MGYSVVSGGRGAVEAQENGLNGGRSERNSAAELFAHHSAAIYRYCLRRLRSPEEAEDALQVTYLNAWRSLKGGFEPRDPRPWLFQIAANVCTSTQRSQLGGPRLELRDPEALEGLVQVEQPQRDAFLDLTAAVRDLPDRQRRALLLRDWQGLAYSEIAATMAVSDAAVETLLFRARNKAAATLISRDWKPRLASSARALLVWPFGVLPTKSALSTGASQLKVGLVVACGTVAPLVTFGVLQIIAFGPEATGRARQTAVLAPMTQFEPADSDLRKGQLLEDLSAKAKGEGRSDHERSGIERPSRSRDESNDPDDGAPTHSAPGAPSPSAAAVNEEKVTVCHQTPSKERPGVTIDVAPQAAQNGLSQDPAGACG
jgi:RNA polymerase sigma-70 factor, ECF subfamily